MYIVDVCNKQTNVIEQQFKLKTAQEAYAKAMELRDIFCTGEHTHYIQISRDDIEV